MDNKQIVKQFIEDLTANQEKAYDVFDENVKASWPGSGVPEIKGKTNLVNFFTENGHNTIVSQEIHNLLEEGDRVFGNGTVVTERNGKQSTAHFADLYRLQNSKIVELESYIIMEKSQS